MVTCIPEAPDFPTTSEREVWELLRGQLGPNDVMFANQRFLDRSKDHELDLLLLLDGFGVVGVEVKGGTVSHDGRFWRQRRSGDEVVIHPVDQVRSAMYSARSYVGRDPRWSHSSRTQVRWGYACVFPYSSLDADFALPDAPRWMVNDHDDLPHLASRLRAMLALQEKRERPAELGDIHEIRDILHGRNRPVFSVSGEADEREAEIDRLTQEQLSLLRVTRLLRRVEVRGGAGSGKTVMALQHAKELARGRGGVKAQRVALICYSRGLAAYFRRVTAAWGRKDRPAFVGTFEELGQSWGAESVEAWRARQSGQGAAITDTPYYEEELPREMARLAAQIPDGTRFDAVIVD